MWPYGQAAGQWKIGLLKDSCMGHGPIEIILGMQGYSEVGYINAHQKNPFTELETGTGEQIL